MTVDMRAVEDMLYKFAEKLQTEVHGEGDRLLALPKPETPEGCRERSVQLRAVAVDCGYMEEVGAAYSVMRLERQARGRELFAGVWPPTNPLDMLAMWTTLLDDIDGIDGDYFDAEGCDEHPLFQSWQAVDAVLLELEPDTIEAATAIKFGAARDLMETGELMSWDEGRVDRAALLAMAELPRPQ